MFKNKILKNAVNSSKRVGELFKTSNNLVKIIGTDNILGWKNLHLQILKDY